MASLPITNQIRLLRFQNGEMTQEDLAQRIGMTRQTVAAIEKGKYAPSLEAAFRIASVFGVTLGDVFQYDQDADPITTKQRKNRS
ncbi:MAG: helix-turn-helix transcriptional regulator [Pseudomonadota bacterium]